jgi:hypothetical protein
MLRPSLLSLCLAVLPLSAQAEIGGLLTRTFPPGEEICFGKVYDAAHFTAHPRQRVSAFYFFKTFTPDSQREEAEFSRAEQVEKDRKGEKVGIWTENARWASVLVRFNDKPGRLFRQEVECTGTDADGFGCGRDCDGGRFSVQVARQGLLLEQDPAFPGLRLQSSCDADEEGSEVRIDPKEDATAFQLERQPGHVCLAQRDAARPSFAAATPLRIRFANRENVCHIRRYDTAHLARHPEQQVAAIAVRTEGPVAVDQEDGQLETRLDVTISLRLRDGTTATKSAHCRADGYQFACSAGGNSLVSLRRAGERGITLRDVNFRKVFDPKENYLANLTGVSLGDDDRAFRLDEGTDALCASE